MDYRIGFGYDVHSFASGRKLILGGVEIPHEKGLLGHSDADVLLHAVCDAMLGALALGDIGMHFPDNDNTYKNIDSKILLEKTYRIINDKNYSVVNLDSTLVIQQPKIAPYVDQMIKSISDILHCSADAISIKATTSEKLGFAGREEGAAAFATVLLKRNGG